MASLPYRALRFVLRQGLELYFVEIQSTGRTRVPKTAPVIFAANHPNSIMDSVILGTQTNRQVSFLARSGLFDNKIVGALLDYFGVIPVYRRQDGPSDPSGNEDAFRRAYEVLETGGTIGIFPEGQNAPERHVRDIKTGTARIALGAEARNDFSLGVQVVPVGLNFADRNAFLTSVLVRFGEPIAAGEYKAEFAADPKGAAVALTERIQQGIRQAAVHLHDERHDGLVRDIHEVYGGVIMDELTEQRPDLRSVFTRMKDSVRGTDAKRKDLDDEFYVQQRIADAVRYYEERDPQLVDRLRRELDHFKRRVEHARLKLDFAARPARTLSRRKESMKMMMYALLLFPIAAWGFVHNIIPFLLVRVLTRRAPDEAMQAFTRLVAGVFAYPLFYGAYGYALSAMTDGQWWRIVLYLATLPAAGFWCLRYRRQLALYADRILTRELFWTERRTFRMLMLERDRLLMQFEQLRRRYFEATGESSRLSPDFRIETSE